MGRSFAISCALVALAGCWEQAQIQLDVTRDTPGVNLDVYVCDSGGMPCTPQLDAQAPIFSDASLTHRVSIFTKQSAVTLHLRAINTTNDHVCVDLMPTSKLDRKVDVHDTSIDWCPPAHDCEIPYTCPTP